MTFKEKLEKFLNEPVGFRVKSDEIADELAKVLDRDERFKDVDGWSWEMILDEARTDYGNKAYISYDKRESRGDCGSISGDYADDDDGYEVPELLNITLRELKKYNGETGEE